MVFDKTIADLDGYLAELEQTLVTLRGETLLLNRNLLRKQDVKTARIDALTSSKARLAARETAIIDNTESTAVQQQLKLRLESLNSGLDIQKQGLLAQYQDSKNESVIGGIPLDSEYVIFSHRRISKHDKTMVLGRPLLKKWRRFWRFIRT